MRNFIFLAVLAVLTSSCISQRGLERNSDFKADLFSAKQLNGVYQNAIPEDPANSLWQDLYKNKSHKDLVFNADNTQVELNLVDNNKLVVTLYRYGRKEDELIFKGKIKNGYFAINRKLTLIPLPFFYYHKENKTIIGNDDEGNLVLVQGKMLEYVVLLSLIGGDRDTISARYEKLD
ncbi:hypothetical protein [Nonlabens agnitus]|uniref:Uncharacterized protein n=1 Tax=Nonlabens agnitus TaxID=870484 RepID=A0A2S9WRG3_9FLAO|nr:hypothetical protein [Nonlabens agnitus]PRP66077.1 hypothetical protein BST86_02735 [Nonlabens agnitus]